MGIGLAETHLGWEEYVGRAEVLIGIEEQRAPQVIGGHRVMADQRSKSKGRAGDCLPATLQRWPLPARKLSSKNKYIMIK